MQELNLPTVKNILNSGEITIKGEFVWGSNYTFLAEVSLNAEIILGVYKPNRGERPLWDFPASSLARREVAAYLVSEALGWGLVPPTVYRKKAPIGPGSLQLYVEHDPEQHYFNLNRDDIQCLRSAVVFDLLVNNADRKGSHLLYDRNHHLWLIDHGVCFHEENKLRTVIWDFVGEPIPAGLLDDLKNFINEFIPDNSIYQQLLPLLTIQEMDALASRAKQLLSIRKFPQPDPDQRSIPWPPL